MGDRGIAGKCYDRGGGINHCHLPRDFNRLVAGLVGDIVGENIKAKPASINTTGGDHGEIGVHVVRNGGAGVCKGAAGFNGDFRLTLEGNHRCSRVDHRHRAGHLGCRVIPVILYIEGYGVFPDHGSIDRVDNHDPVRDVTVKVIQCGGTGVRICGTALNGNVLLTQPRDDRWCKVGHDDGTNTNSHITGTVGYLIGQLIFTQLGCNSTKGRKILYLVLLLYMIKEGIFLCRFKLPVKDKNLGKVISGCRRKITP